MKGPRHCCLKRLKNHVMFFAFLAVSLVGMHGETNMFLACGSDIMEMNVQGRRVTSHLYTPWPPAWQFSMLRYQRRTT